MFFILEILALVAAVVGGIYFMITATGGARKLLGLLPMAIVMVGYIVGLLLGSRNMMASVVVVMFMLGGGAMGIKMYALGRVEQMEKISRLR